MEFISYRFYKQISWNFWFRRVGYTNFINWAILKRLGWQKFFTNITFWVYRILTLSANLMDFVIVTQVRVTANILENNWNRYTRKKLKNHQDSISRSHIESMLDTESHSHNRLLSAFAFEWSLDYEQAIRKLSDKFKRCLELFNCMPNEYL